MRRNVAWSWIAGLALAIPVLSATAEIVTLDYSKVVYDGYFDRGLQDGFYANANILTYNPGGPRIQDGLIRFDLSGVSVGPGLMKATLRLYRFGSDATYPVHVWQIEDGQPAGTGVNDWTSGATWDKYDGVHAWDDVDLSPSAHEADVEGARLQSTRVTQQVSSGQPLGYLEWDVTRIALNWLVNGHPNYGFLITSHEENDYYGGEGGTFYDSENVSNPGLGPELVFDLWHGERRTVTPAVVNSGWVGLTYGVQESYLNKDEGGGLRRLLLYNTAPTKRCGLIEFDLAVLQALSWIDAKLLSATLSMTAHAMGAVGGMTVEVYRIGGSNRWDTTASYSYQSRSPSDVAWKNAGTGADGTVADVHVGAGAVMAIPAAGSWGGATYTASADVTDIVRSWVMQGATNCGMRLQSANLADDQTISFYGHLANVAAALKPTLTVLIDGRQGTVILVR